MPQTDVKAAVQDKERNLLIVLGVIAAAALVYATFPAVGFMKQLSIHPAETRKSQPMAGTRPALPVRLREVRLGDLKQRASAQGEAARNPFKFYVTTPLKPAAPPAPAPLKPGDEGYGPRQPAPSPIPIKFIGVVAQGTKKVAIFSDGNGSPVWASEGQTVLGEYKLLKISVESVTMSYLDGSGMQTIPMRG